MKPLFYSALFGSGLLVGTLVSHQPSVGPVNAASGASKYECVGFDSDDNGEATVAIHNLNGSSIGGRVKWHKDDGDQVDDDIEFDIDGHGTVRESSSKKGIVHATIKADGPIVVDGRLKNDIGMVSVKCQPRTD